MPGKVNPVIPEVINQIAFRVIGNDLTIKMGSEAGAVAIKCNGTSYCIFFIRKR